MPFQTPITIAKALDRVHRHEYVLPAIQREFVWATEQICKLFDSLMRGYPVGSFLFWKVQKENCNKYVFYDFVRDYHERDAPHCTQLNLTGEDAVTAILDGQQRLTSLNIGLRGSHAERLPYKRWTNSAAYPKKFLYLDLLGVPEDAERGLKYGFSFLTEAEAKVQTGPDHHWFRVGQILSMEAGPPMFDYVQEHGLASSKEPFARLHRLHAVVHQDATINFYEEEDQDLDRVLNIFIRVNSGGTVLSYADLLLSIATAQWTNRDAREAVYGLVDNLNLVKNGFGFPKDLVLKSCLVLADIPDVGFKVTNFDAANMKQIDAQWDRMAAALTLAARLLGDFGFSDRTLTANNVIIPIAYYLMKREAAESYLTSKGEADDREQVRRWAVRSLVKVGTWGSALDTLLRRLREEIRETSERRGERRFPTERLETAMAPLGKSLKFGDEEIEVLLDSRYGRKGTFSVLSLLYPGADLRNEFHEDHVFPKSMFTRKRLLAVGVPGADVDAYLDRADQLPNLQLMLGPENIAKSDQLPHAWVAVTYANETDRGFYLGKHDLGGIPASLTEFPAWFDARRDRMKTKLKALLGVT